MSNEQLVELSKKLTEMVECGNGMCMHCIDLLIEAREIMQTLLLEKDEALAHG